MAGKPTCLVCQKEMQKGFMTDSTYGGIKQPRWCAGLPKLNWLWGISPSQASKGITIVAYRCPECEALRLYAPSQG
jgi:ssDNA-binding Zn-finger/Zn-ribbon topoisomerase 1